MSGERHCELSRNAIFLNGLEYILLLLTLLSYPGFSRPASQGSFGQSTWYSGLSFLDSSSGSSQ